MVMILAGVSQSVSSVAQLCPTLCDPMNRSTPGLPVHQQSTVNQAPTCVIKRKEIGMLSLLDRVDRGTGQERESPEPRVYISRGSLKR